MPRKPECKIVGCTRHCFATEDVCLPHWRMLTMTYGDEPESPSQPPGDDGHAGPVPSPPPVPAVPAPTVSSPKPAWVEWAVNRHGIARETAELATKRQLIDLCSPGADWLDDHTSDES